MDAVLILLAAVAAAFAAAGGRERRIRRADAVRKGREVAEQKSRREAELREQSQRTSALFDRMVEGVIVVDASGRIRLANRAAPALFGFEGTAVGKTVLEATRHHEVATVV